MSSEAQKCAIFVVREMREVRKIPALSATSAVRFFKKEYALEPCSVSKMKKNLTFDNKNLHN